MRIILSIFFILISSPQFAQHQEDGVLNFSPEESFLRDDSMSVKQKHFIQDLYHNATNQSNELSNGREYKFYFYPQITNPFIPKDQLPAASIVIQGRKYENIILLYDTYKDLVVYSEHNSLANNLLCPIVINKHTIDEFSLQWQSRRLRFKYFEFPDNPKEKMKSGFYEMVYDEDNCRLIIKHTSELAVRDGRDTYQYHAERYVENGGIYYHIKGKKSLLKALTDKKTEVKKYIRTSNIFVRWAENEEILNILKYYNSLP